MINEFSYMNNRNKIILPINIGAKNLFYDNDYDNGNVKRFFEEGRTSLLWENGEKTILISSDDYSYNGVPSTDLKYIISVYFHDGDIYPNIDNACIYNADGSLYKNLKVPKLISKLSKSHYRKTTYPNLIFFSSVRQQFIESLNKNVIVMVVGYNLDWYEDRILDVETGEFGECVGSGRF